MDILEILRTRQADIYLPLFMTLLGLMLGLILYAVLHRRYHYACQENEAIVSITVANVINPRLTCRSRYSKDEGLMLFIGLAALVSSGIYLFNRVAVLNLFYYCTVFIMSLWTGGFLYSLLKGQYSGWHWAANITFYAIFFIVLFMAMGKAITPNYAPANFQYSQQIVNQHGILGLGNYFSALDIRWFIFHLLGVLLLFIAMFRLCLSATYFAVMGRYILSEESREPWLARKTRKYAKFWENIIFVSLLLFAAYYLIAGDFFMWFEYEMPNRVDSFMNALLHGL
ncbi:hypothetical protein C1H69_01760 [Billgrantia endophytica]|uniref:Uncharacterized protein n=2 Tax=Billgrantia endophytica TaxID=2033802 RepID=A0A2N7UB44_9GAMM|nr:hypothetical protein C1H69_01760 [Halomonas endophytica]